MFEKILQRAFLLSLFFCLHSCYKDIQTPLPDGVRLKPGIAIPLISADLSIENSLVLLGDPPIDIDTLIPYWANYDTIYFIDTLAFFLPEIQDTVEAIRYIEFNLSLWNDFPSFADFQVFFIDENFSRVDSLFSPNMLKIVNGDTDINDGTVIRRGFSSTNISYIPERIEKLSAAKQVVLYSRVSNIGIVQEQFDHYLEYNLSVKISARIGIDYIFN
jgi:hypothetical protein